MEGAAHANQRQAVAASPGRSRTVESLPSLVAGVSVCGLSAALAAFSHDFPPFTLLSSHLYLVRKRRNFGLMLLHWKNLAVII